MVAVCRTALSTPPEASVNDCIVKPEKSDSGGRKSIADFELRIADRKDAERKAQSGKNGFAFSLFPAMDKSYVTTMDWGEGIISPQADLSAEGEIAKGLWVDLVNRWKKPL